MSDKVCCIQGCGRTTAARGWCMRHYKRWRQHGDQLKVVIRTRNTSPCSIEGCHKVVAARGWCVNHYQLWKTYGSPYGSSRVEPSTEERFRAKVNTNGPESVSWDGAPLGSGCWLWTGKPAKNGYGVISVNNTDRYAHRLSYELHIGPIPDGLTIDHLCMVRLCVNPEHLEPVTRSENTRRELIIRHNKEKTA